MIKVSYVAQCAYHGEVARVSTRQQAEIEADAHLGEKWSTVCKMRVFEVRTWEET